VLEGDVQCAGASGLIVGADNTRINLNGHTISCTGAGFQGSCQAIQGYNIPAIGISSPNHRQVAVLGPGTITGFHTGIVLSGGPGLLVTSAVTGPPAPDFTQNQRQFNAGIVIEGTTCGFLGISALVMLNDVSNQEQGIQLSNTQCVSVVANNVHDNNGVIGDAHGIAVIGAGRNLIDSNFVHGNGAQFNNIARNQVRFNTALGQGAQCRTLDTDPFFDLAEFNEGPLNTWNLNNQCRTEGPGIFPGVCNPGE
jgi:hypothetical protein